MKKYPLALSIGLTSALGLACNSRDSVSRDLRLPGSPESIQAYSANNPDSCPYDTISIYLRVTPYYIEIITQYAQVLDTTKISETDTLGRLLHESSGKKAEF